MIVRHRAGHPWRECWFPVAALVCGAVFLGLTGCGAARRRARSVNIAGAECVSRQVPPLCYTPKQLRVAYGAQPLVEKGIDGRGQVVVLLERPEASGAREATDIEKDLGEYDRRFSLPAANLDLLRFGAGSRATIAGPEEVLDVEAVHAMAPGAQIDVVPVEAVAFRKGGYAEARALNHAVDDNLGGIISLGIAGGEECTTAEERAVLEATLRAAQTRHISVIAGSGDLGAIAEPCGPGPTEPVRGVVLPASDPLVTAAGGTSLMARKPSGYYESERAWYSPPGTTEVGTASAGSGGGFSTLFPRPRYQADVEAIHTHRGVPDVAADADPNTGLALLAVVKGAPVIFPASGTSAAAPVWAAVAALADQYARRRLGFLNAGLYRVAAGSSYHRAFHDITRGSNAGSIGGRRVPGYATTPGWDPATGLGSPDASILIPLLVRAIHPGDGNDR